MKRGTLSWQVGVLACLVCATAGDPSDCSVSFRMGAITGEVWVEDVAYEEIVAK